MWYCFPCFINHLKFCGKLWGEKWWKREVSKEASKQQKQLLCNRWKNNKMDINKNNKGHPSFQSNCRLAIIVCVIWLCKQDEYRNLKRKMWDHRAPHRWEWYQCKEQKKGQSQREWADCPAIKSSIEIQRKVSSEAGLSAKAQTWLRSSSSFVALEQDLSPKIWVSEWMLFSCSAEWGSGTAWPQMGNLTSKDEAIR